MVSLAAHAPDLRRRLLDWYDATGRDLPWRRTRDPYAVLVSELMLQQTQAGRVAEAWTAFLERFPTVRALADAPTAEVLGAWRGLGYNRRAVHLHRAAGAIIERHGGEVPSAIADLEALPGVGPYTARAVAAFAFGALAAPVDVNVARVLSRAVAGRPLTRSQAQALADRMAALPDEGLPRSAGRRGHGGAAGDRSTERACGDDPGQAGVADDGCGEHWAESDGRGLGTGPDQGAARDGMRVAGPGTWSQALMDLGARRCTARAPACGHCPVVSCCAWAVAGHPPPDPAAAGSVRARPQGPFDGSDRYHRGRLVDAMRAGPVAAADLASAANLHGDPSRLGRLVAGLVRDGLGEWRQGRLGLPGGDG